jgi:GNAT superfamily N-acetyltransferase
MNGNKSAVTYRSHRPGDIGHIIHRHGVFYAEQYGADEKFEALVARIMADFVDNYDPARERCWIAERDGQILGFVCLVKDTESGGGGGGGGDDDCADTARLRVLFVEPAARGLGIGRQLVQNCLDFARETGYRRIVLFTQSALTSAIRLYADAGFKLIDENESKENYFSSGGRTQIFALDLTEGAGR